MWPEDDSVDRKWLLEHAQGAAGLLVMVSEQVCRSPSPQRTVWLIEFNQIDAELLDAGKNIPLLLTCTF